MKNDQQESNTHIINEFDRHNQLLIVTDTQAPLQTPRPGRGHVTIPKL